MPVLAPEEMAAVEVRREGAYLTDGRSLFRVLPETGGNAIWLENCRFPDMLPQELTVAEVRARMRLVRPTCG